MNKILGALVLTAASFGYAADAGSDPLDDVVSARFVPGWVQSDGTHMAALELSLAPGWKTYWRSPGDAGIPPQFDWSGSSNLGGVHVHWPTPRVFWQAGMRSVGYKGRVVLPLTVAPRGQSRDVRLKARIDLGICSDICVPHRIDVSGVLPADSTARPAPIVAALAELPFSRAEAGVKSANCTIAPAEDGVSVTAQLAMPSSGGQEAAVMETASPGIWVSEPETRRDGGTLTVTARMVAHDDGSPMLIDRSSIRITVIGSSYAVDIQGCAD